jgi:predicted PolB exonuclease-like 3'-5' exonuclease
MMPVLAFDIETIPDVDGLRKLHGVDGSIADKDVADMAFQLRRQTSGSDFLPLHLQRVVTIACALRDRDTFRVWSFGEPEDTEATLIQRFFDGIERYVPQIVSWNGGGFDLPVLHYRGLIHGVRAARYWDLGEDDRDFKWNNYISRYHMRHLDLMDLLALYQPRAAARLDQIAQLAGFPGKLGMDGSQVWDAYQAGKIAEIRHYCETDVVNTYLVYLRFQMMRGALTGERYDAECAVVRTSLDKTAGPHWQEFLDHWKT